MSVRLQRRLNVSPRAIEFLAFAHDIVVQLPEGQADRADRLVRAAESVVRKLAQGAGRWSEADCAKHDKMAIQHGDARAGGAVRATGVVPHSGQPAPSCATGDGVL
ncbi:MAG: hypothetical protein MUF54_03425 [Polyangiaceae bacterium]|nr:hypothetical protein [Polyangiaceae bacterium]